ncbi:hypothetical protein Pst134EA_032658 [Puccinia striiformis f. sp. tritici]|uniref:uncharacterized protein n=1 Tax=Puccinia striiformis f. sp. tritici TaxID=168172 RepID=UPI002008295D|nr:uncharacterized protein Pst134EA_032658 [Puccinia striiformis f. sp. tritici]KAH9443468.1 hypothetical protein Pst134EA_032658 [Puccinia striiformis f. sp. tritici]
MSEPLADSDWQNLSVQDQLHLKLWKARPATHETLIKQFQLAEDEDDEVFSDWNRDQQWPQKAVTDSNASGESLATNARRRLREAATECLLGWAMSEANGDKGEGIVSPVLEGLKSKQPKVVAGAVAALSAHFVSEHQHPQHTTIILSTVPNLLSRGYSFSAFGVRVINIKPILKALPQMFAHADKGVREEITGSNHLSVSWCCARRGAQAALKASTSQNDPEGDDPAEEPEAVDDPPKDIDPYDLADPVAILDQLPSGFYQHLASSK